jgi:hypothetical protein
MAGMFFLCIEMHVHISGFLTISSFLHYLSYIFTVLVAKSIKFAKKNEKSIFNKNKLCPKKKNFVP